MRLEPEVTNDASSHPIERAGGAKMPKFWFSKLFVVASVWAYDISSQRFRYGEVRRRTNSKLVFQILFVAIQKISIWRSKEKTNSKRFHNSFHCHQE